jgi:uncharacterized protein with PIN domain
MSQNSVPPRLLVDATLGRLARWLRLAGYDTVYLADIDALSVIRLARAEDRLILTRDAGLASRKGVDALLINARQVEDQLTQVREAVGSPGQDAPSRCSTCNETLDPLSVEAARDRVPPYVWRTHERFMACRSCRRVYWPGTHWQAISAGLDEN